MDRRSFLTSVLFAHPLVGPPKPVPPPEPLTLVTPDVICGLRPVYSNAEYSLWMPQDFKRYLSCEMCQTEWPFREAYPKFVEFSPSLIAFRGNVILPFVKMFRGHCPICKNLTVFTHRDRGTGKERLDRVNIGELLVGDAPFKDGGLFDDFSVYLWNPAPEFRNKIKNGDSELIERTPWDVVEACCHNAILRIHPQKLRIERHV